MSETARALSARDIALTLHRAGRSAVVGSLTAGGVLAAVLWDPSMAWTFGGWLALLGLAAAWRVHGMWRFERVAGGPFDPHACIADFERRVAGSGLAWAAGGVLFASRGDLTAHVLYALCVCGLTAGAVAAFFVHLRAVFAFAVPAIVPYSVLLMLMPGRSEIVIGGCLLAFGAIVAIVAVQVHDSLAQVLPVRRQDGSPHGPETRSLARRRVDHLYRTALLTAFGSVLAASVVLFVLRGTVELRVAALWMAAIVAATGLRLLKVLEFRRGARGEVGPGYWLTNFNYPLVLVGAAWATGAIVLPGQDNLLGDMVMTLCVFGLVAGAVAGFSSHMSAVLSLALPTVVPFAAHLLAHRDPIYATLGGALLVFSALIVVAGLRVGRLVREGFAHEVENETLLAAQQERNREIAALNQTLEARVRTRTEELQVLVGELRDKTEQLLDSRERYYTIVEQTNEVIVGVDDRGAITFANAACRRVLGLTEADIARGVPLASFVRPESIDAVRAAIGALSEGRDVDECELVLGGRDQNTVYLDGSLRAGFDAHGERSSFGVFTDVTANRVAEAALQTSEARFRAIFEHGSTGIMIVAPDRRVIEANARAGAILQADGAPITGVGVHTLVGSEHRAFFEQNLMALFDGALPSVTLEMQCPGGGRSTWAQFDLNVIEDAAGRIRFVAVLLQDVSERRALAEALSYNASHDYLTGLINRREIEHALEEIIETARPEQPSALVYFDLDRFKLINDTCGHATGDALLRELSVELARLVPSDCRLARLGGDEFALLIPATSSGEAHVVARTLVDAIAKFDFEHEGRRHVVGASAGIVMIDGSESLQTTLQEADAACYAAKRSGHNRIEIYNPDKDDMRLQRDQIRAAAKLADALHENQLTLYAQPIVRTAQSDSAAQRYELLLRLVAQDGSVSGPGELLPAAERYGYATEVDRWVVRRTLEMLSACPTARVRGLMLAVNLSGQSLLSEDFADFLADSLDEHAHGTNLCFEITESQFISNLDQATRLMRRVRSYGCRFALDDFGTGFSSYGYLKELDVDYLKIDGTFVRDIDTNAVDEAIVSSIAGVARAIGKQTVAEYVERDGQLDVLRRLRVDMVQGHRIGVEGPLEAVLAPSGVSSARG